MNLDGYLEYVSKYNIDNNDINIQVSPNMLEISQVIFNIGLFNTTTIHNIY